MPTSAPTPDAFTQQFLKQTPQGDPDKLYDLYLKSVQTPQLKESQYQPGAIMSLMRQYLPFMDTTQGHQMLQTSLQSYPFTPSAGALVGPKTVIRTSDDPKVIEEEAEEDPEKYLGIKTGREKAILASKGMISPPSSVTTHELMHAYLNQKGYPYGEKAFDKDWESAKKTTPLLSTIDSWLASSPDYKDEMNRSDISQERYAYLAQALSGGGLGAFPQSLQRHYAPVFQQR